MPTKTLSTAVAGRFRFVISAASLFSIFMAPVNASAADCKYKAGPPDAGVANLDNSVEHSGVVSAWYGDATTAYTHGVLGDAVEAHTLYAVTQGSDECALAITLDEYSVFEDVTPRIADVTGDGENNVVTIQSHRDKGASLAVYGIENQQLVKIASAPYIGKSFRWLAPAGIADFNNDNVKDVAYVQTPHIGGILKIWSFKAGRPELLASKPGFSNHQIGQNYITGGLRECGGTAELVLPDQRWSRTLIARPVEGSINVDVYADRVDEATIAQALRCQ